MTNRTAANRYARALLDVALKAIVDLFQQNQTLQKVLLNPAVPVSRKQSAVAEIARQAALMDVVRKLLILLAERDRLIILPELLAAFRDRLMEHQNVVRAEVTTTVALAPERLETIRQRLAEVTGRTVNLSSRVDPALIGGMIARVGGTVYDGSVTMQLRKMRAQLSEGL
jgi:F-type H+-transporting ATPase subunit delta